MSLDTDQGRLRKGSFSFYEETLQQLERLAEQRKQEKDTDLQKIALQIGTIFLSMSKGRLDPTTGRIGHWNVDDLAEDLRQWVLLGSDWLERHGHPINSGSPQAFTSLLGALAMNMSGSLPQGATQPTAVAPPSVPEELEEPPVEAMIGGNVLSSLNLDESPML
jgi:hypothetical protein